jgi:peptide-methionine (S)-S-oxide reductase
MSAIVSATAVAADEKSAPAKTEEAILGGGCFWCTEGCYLPVKGVVKVISGYSGGHVENPTYEQVCTKTTGHAEVIKVVFDPSVVSYKDLVELFWYAHDPTTLNRQGNDVGPQYRSVIYYTNDEQKKIAEASVKEHQKEFKDPIVTEIAPLKNFYAAEDYHQDFANKNPNQGYVCAVVKPKVEKFSKKLKELSKGK